MASAATTTVRGRTTRREIQTAPLSISASELSRLVNSYKTEPGPPRKIIFPNASKLAQIQEVSAKGTLLPRQRITLDHRTNKRTMTRNPAGYEVDKKDGDLHLNLGTRSLQPHITCEVQNARPSLQFLNAAVGKPVVISGFFRCLFEHPGFDPADNAHIFEIHPVRAVSVSGKIQSFDIATPDQDSIEETSPEALIEQDKKIQVSYNSTTDTLTFTGMEGRDENYVRLGGTMSQVSSDQNEGPASFLLTGTQLASSISVVSLQGTAATGQLNHMRGSEIEMIALRNIDLRSALDNRYVTKLLAIDIQSPRA